MHQKVVGSILGQGTYLSCSSNPGQVAYGGQLIDVFLTLMSLCFCFYLSLSLPLPLSGRGLKCVCMCMYMVSPESTLPRNMKNKDIY